MYNQNRMKTYEHDRKILELPMIKPFNSDPSGYLEWMKYISTLYFFKNQHEVFSCFLTDLNQKVYISYSDKINISRDFAHFVLLTLPKVKRDKRKRFYKPTHLL